MALQETTLAEALQEARNRTGLTQERVGELMRAATGDPKSPSNGKVKGWFRGYYFKHGNKVPIEPTVREYNLLAQILNEHLERVDDDWRLPGILFLKETEGNEEAPAVTGASIIPFRVSEGDPAQMSYSVRSRLRRRSAIYRVGRHRGKCARRSLSLGG